MHLLRTGFVSVTSGICTSHVRACTGHVQLEVVLISNDTRSILASPDAPVASGIWRGKAPLYSAASGTVLRFRDFETTHLYHVRVTSGFVPVASESRPAFNLITSK